MIVVADASPLNYLIQIHADELLYKTFGRVLVPSAVIQELRHPRAPRLIAAWVSRIPSWIDICVVTDDEDESLKGLDPGEREAIQLAQETRADLLLIDERQGRLEARRRGITTTGTLGVLLEAGTRGLANPERLFSLLVSDTSFRATASLREFFLAECAKLERKQP